MTDPVPGSVRIGRYGLEVGAFTESYAAFEPGRENRNVKALRDALAEESEELHSPVAALEELQANAETVTARCERAQELSRAAAEGRLLESHTLMAEVDSLLSLAERLDRDGRFDEELRLLRALHGVLVLTRRWLDLIRALRRALSAAEEAGALAEQAWIRHELGSLHLCADEPEAAAEQFRQALQLQRRLGQATGTCATRHNLDSADRDIATRTVIKPRSRRLLRLAGVAGVLTLLAVGGTTIALAQGDDPPSPTAPTSTSGTDTATSPTPGTSGTTDPTIPSTPGTTGTVDTTAPVVALLTPPDGSVIPIPTPEFSGTAGVEAGDAAEVLVEILDENGRPPADSPLSAPVVEGAWTVTPTFALPDGTYQATARQSDGDGNTGSSATATFTIDTTEPDTSGPELTLACDDEFGPDSLTIKCALTSTDAGTVRFEFTETQFLLRQEIEVESSVENDQTVELEADTPPVAFELTLPHEDLDQGPATIRAFVVVAVQSDATGNFGRSNEERTVPFSVD
jgi:hypothetical protein